MGKSVFATNFKKFEICLNNYEIMHFLWKEWSISVYTVVQFEPNIYSVIINETESLVINLYNVYEKTNFEFFGCNFVFHMHLHHVSI